MYSDGRDCRLFPHFKDGGRVTDPPFPCPNPGWHAESARQKACYSFRVSDARPLIRDATQLDCHAIAAIYAETVAARDATMDLEPRPPEYFAGIIAALGEREAFVVLERGGEVIGWGRVMAYSDREGYATTCETAVYLKRELRRKRLGTHLKRHIIKLCRRFGYHHLVAKVYAGNRASIEYNKQLGYELVGVQREVGWVDDHWEDVAIMQLVLDEVPPPGEPG